MAAAIGLRTDYNGSGLRQLARSSTDANQTRRLLALAAVYDGASRTMAANIGDVGLQIVRDWVVRFNAEGPDGLIDRMAPGQPPKLSTEQRAALARIVEDGPIPAVHGVVRWRLVDLMAWVGDEFGISLSEAAMSRQLRSLGFVKISARPRHHAQNGHAIEAFKKTSPPSWRRSEPASSGAPR
jgi:transposase